MSESEGEESKPLPTGIVKKRFHNGWTGELEDMMADWADKAACYRWMHEKTSALYGIRDRSFNIPVIILSGVTAGANFALNSIFGDNDKENQKWAQLGLGGASLIAGIIQTLMNFYGYAKGSEAHRLAGISWGKFNRQVCIEMRMHPDERQDSINFLKWFRIELDRLIEQSPIIPEVIVKDFNKMFKGTDIVKPEITGILQHTRVFKDTNSRLKRLAAEATIALQYKKGVIKQLVADDLERKTRVVAIDAARKVALGILAEEKAKAAAAVAAVAEAAKEKAKKKMTPFVEKQKEERQEELKELAKKKIMTVASIRTKFAQQLFGGEGSPVQLPGMTAPEEFSKPPAEQTPAAAQPPPVQIPKAESLTNTNTEEQSVHEYTVEQVAPGEVQIQMDPSTEPESHTLTQTQTQTQTHTHTEASHNIQTADFLTPQVVSEAPTPAEPAEQPTEQSVEQPTEKSIEAQEAQQETPVQQLPGAIVNELTQEQIQEQEEIQREEEESKKKGWFW
jgi:hypothetical protein